MKKRIIIFSFIFLLAIIGYLYWKYIYLEIPRKVKLFQEYEATSKRQTNGKAWIIIFDEDMRLRMTEKFEVEIPKINFKKNYLLLSDGRKVIELKYRLSSRYKWWFDRPMGEVTFDKEHYLHTIFFYKINRVIILQESP